MEIRTTLDARPQKNKVVVKRLATIKDKKIGSFFWVQLWGMQLLRIEEIIGGRIILSNGSNIGIEQNIYVPI